MIECKKIVKTYISDTVETQALKGVSFTVDDGELVAIVGPSGSGKSTLMHILGALDKPTSGTYILDGLDMSRLPDATLADVRKNKIGFVFQSFNLLPRATVIRNVELPLIYAGVDARKRHERAIAALHDVGMEDAWFNNRSNQLSGGQMQRVAIARALVNNPSIILADEPTGNLDTKTSKIIMKTFQSLHKKGRTIIIITHETDIAAYAKRVITIRDGKIEHDEVQYETQRSFTRDGMVLSR